MLEKIREASKGWFAGILILALVGSVGLWGVSDMLNLTEQPRIARVGDQDVTPDAFQREFQRFLSQMTRATGNEMTTEQAKAEGLDRVALDRHLDRLALSQIATDMKLTISPPQVVEALRPVRGVVDSAGKLVPGAIAQLAQSNNLSEADFVALIQSDLVREQLLRSVAGGVGMPVGMQRALDLFRLERRVAQYLIVDPSRAGNVGTPDDKALKAYFDQNALQRYAIPEHRNVVFIALRPDDVAKKITVPDADIAKLYEANRKRYEVPEKRVFDQIRFKSEAEAKAGQARLDAGETFEAVAKSQGFAPNDIAIGEIARGDKSVPDEAFEIAEGKTTPALKNSFGLWVILRATSITPGTTRTLAEATEEIRKAIVDTKVKEEIFEFANQLEDTIGEGATLEEAAGRLKLQLESAIITREGDNLAGDPVTTLPAGNFLRQAFDAEQGNDPELQQTPEGVYYMFRVDRVTPVTKKDFVAVKADVLRDWTDAQVSKRLDAVAADILKRARAGEKLEAIAASQGLSLVTSDPLPRFGKTAVFGEATITSVSNTKKGDLFSGPVAFGKGVVVGRVTDIQFQDEPADSPLKSAYGQRLLQVFVSDFVEQFEAGARAQVGSEIDEKRFQAFRNNE
jgi:peptidyl-prolyl cis-trans isomerase D